MNLRRDILAIIILSLAVILILSRIGISYTLSKSKPKILKLLTDTSGHRFDLEGISFNLLRGIHLKGLSVFYQSHSIHLRSQDKPSVFIKDAFASIRLLPLIFKRTLAVQINVNEGVFLVNKNRGLPYCKRYSQPEFSGRYPEIVILKKDKFRSN